MSYVPNSVQVYTACFTGAMAGIGIDGRFLVDSTAADYATLAATARQWAIVFDTQWASALADGLQVEMMFQGSMGLFNGRGAVASPNLFLTNAKALIAAITAAETDFTGQSITPPAWGGAGTVTNVTGTAPITSTGGATPAIGITKPVRAFGTNAGLVTLTAAAQIVASALFTPATSGKMTIFVSGVVDNGDSSSTVRPVVTSLSVAASATPAIFTQITQNIPGSSTPTGSAVAACVPLDLLGAPTTFVVGVASRVNVNMIGDGSGQLTIPIGGVQIYAQEALG